MSLFISRRGISNSTRSPIRCTLNRPDLVCACAVTIRLYGCGFGAPVCAAPPPAAPRPPRPPNPPAGVSLESVGLVGACVCCWGAALEGPAGTGVGADALGVPQPIATTALAAARTTAELVRIYTC